jgi:hypothetical protein
VTSADKMELSRTVQDMDKRPSSDNDSHDVVTTEGAMDATAVVNVIVVADGAGRAAAAPTKALTDAVPDCAKVASEATFKSSVCAVGHHNMTQPPGMHTHKHVFKHTCVQVMTTCPLDSITVASEIPSRRRRDDSGEMPVEVTLASDTLPVAGSHTTATSLPRMLTANQRTAASVAEK